MAFTFANLRDHIARERFLSTEFYGETVTYRTPTLPDVTIDVHIEHVEQNEDDDPNRVKIDRIKVRIHRDDITNPPDLQHAIRRAGDSRDYLFAFAGKHDEVLYYATFERRRQQSAGLT